MIAATLHGAVASASLFRGVIQKGLVLHYNTFNTESYNKTGTTIYDLTSNNLNGTITGAPAWNVNYFTFANDYITTANLAPSLTEVHTCEVWIYPTGNGVVMQANAQPTPNASYHHSTIEIVSGNLEFGLWDGSGITSTGATSAISLNQWSQVVLTYNGSTVKGYLNGELVGSVNVVWDSPEDSTGSFYYNFGYQDFTSQGDGTNFDGRFGIMRVYDVELSAPQVRKNYLAVSGNLTSLVTDQLVLYYDPSNTASYSGTGTSLLNLAPTTLTGTSSNVTYTNPYFSFNGSSSQISIPDNAILEPGSGNFTLEAWVRFDTFATTSVIAGKFSPGGLAADVSYALRANTSGEIRFEIGNGAGSLNAPIYSGSVGVWYHLVGVINNTTNEVLLYVNGASLGASVMTYTSILNTSTNLYLGSYNNGEYAQYLDGDLGVVRAYKKALSSTEVLANYNFEKDIYL
jgi:hypothetical protein